MDYDSKSPSTARELSFGREGGEVFEGGEGSLLSRPVFVFSLPKRSLAFQDLFQGGARVTDESFTRFLQSLHFKAGDLDVSALEIGLQRGFLHVVTGQTNKLWEIKDPETQSVDLGT